MSENPPEKVSQIYSIPSIVAIIAAIAIFFAETAGGMMALSIVAIIFGIVGMMMALSPKVRGGLASTLAVAVAALGVLVAITKGILHLF